MAVRLEMLQGGVKLVSKKKRKERKNVAFTRGKETYGFGSYDTVEEAEAVAISIRQQLEKDSIEIVKKRFDQENVRILCRLLFFSLNSPRV